MSSVKLVIFKEDHVSFDEVEALTEHTLKEVLHEAGHPVSAEVFWFMDDGVEVAIDMKIREISNSNRIVVRRHRCQKAYVTIEHNGQAERHTFTPAQKISLVKHWAVDHFKLEHPHQWFLSTNGNKEGELPDHDHIGKYIEPDACSLKLVLARHEPDMIKVTVNNEDDGSEFILEGTQKTTVEKLIEKMYVKLNRTPKNDDRLTCEKGGSNVLSYRELTMEEYVKAGHCACLVWLFAGGTGGALCQ